MAFPANSLNGSFQRLSMNGEHQPPSSGYTANAALPQRCLSCLAHRVDQIEGGVIDYLHSRLLTLGQDNTPIIRKNIAERIISYLNIGQVEAGRMRIEFGPGTQPECSVPVNGYILQAQQVPVEEYLYTNLSPRASEYVHLPQAPGCEEQQSSYPSSNMSGETSDHSDSGDPATAGEYLTELRTGQNQSGWSLNT